MTTRRNCSSKLLRHAMALTILSCLIQSGCGKSDLSGYRTVKQNEGQQSGKQFESTSIGEPVLPDSHSPVSIETASQDDQAANAGQLATTATTEDVFVPVSALLPVNVLDGANVQALLKAVPRDAASSTDQPVITKTSATIASSDSNAPADATKTEPAEPRKVELLIREKTFRPDGKSKALRVSYDDLDLLKILNMDPVTIDAVDLMPGWLTTLSGQQIKIRGFMFPTFESEGLERFVLARDNQICCFGRDPKVYDLVEVSMKEGKTTNYIPATRSFDVVGRLRIKMIESEGKPYGLYFLEDAEVIDR